MKRALWVVVLCFAVVGLTSVNAAATTIPLAIGDTSYIGFFVPPGDNADSEAIGIEILIGFEADSVHVVDSVTYDRYDGLALPLPALLYDPLDPDSYKEDSSNNLVVPVGWTGTVYVIGKYDNTKGGSVVWLVDVNPGDVLDLPNGFDNPYDTSSGETGLSHTEIFRAGSYKVPDGGATLMLLGGALVGLGALRRRYQK